jgi:hypothetical protein
MLRRLFIEGAGVMPEQVDEIFESAPPKRLPVDNISAALREIDGNISDNPGFEVTIRRPYEQANAKVVFLLRTLGRAMLERAIHELGTHDEIQEIVQFAKSGDPMSAVNSMANYFLYKNWRDAHPEYENDKDDFDNVIYDEHEPSPRNLGEWPNGNKVNCLGIAIALSATCEMAGLQYAFINRLRNSKTQALRDFVVIREMIEKSLSACDYPELILKDSTLKTFFNRDFGDIDERDREENAAFHHSVIAHIAEPEAATGWVQVDPYQMILGRLGENKLISQIVNLHGLVAHSEPGTVVTVNMNGPVRNRARHDADMFAKSRLSHIEFASQSVLRSAEQAVDRVEQVLRRQFADFGHTVEQSDEIEAYIAKEKLDLIGDWVRIEHRLGNIATLESYAFRWDATEEKGMVKMRQDSIIEGANSILKKHPELKKRLTEFVSLVPIKQYVGIYDIAFEEKWENSWLVDTSFEIADPEFMIGALYLNHYLRWKEEESIDTFDQVPKDDIIPTDEQRCPQPSIATEKLFLCNEPLGSFLFVSLLHVLL